MNYDKELDIQIKEIEKHLDFLKSLKGTNFYGNAGDNSPWTEEELDEYIDLESWYAMFKEEPQPAKAVVPKGDYKRSAGRDVWVKYPVLTKADSEYLTKRFKALDGAKVNDTHVFKELGRQKHSSSSGPVLVFACVPIRKE